MVSCARCFIVEICRAHAIDDGIIDAIALACHEALTNVVRHAHGHDLDKQVHVSCLPFSDRIEIQIEDEGPPFDLTKVPELDPAELRVGGRGVFLMRTIFDEVAVVPRSGGHGNLLRLVKHCSTRPLEPSTG